jgi:hypothetical protein
MAQGKAAGMTRLIVSDEKKPAIQIKKGMRVEVREVVFNTPDLKKISQAARLCGMGGACLAIIDLGDAVINPAKKTK